MTNSTSDPHGSSVLIVDDEENMRHMLSAILSRTGFSTQTAGNGEQALAMLAERAFDFILCDIKMPRMDGIAFLRAYRKLPATGTVIMMSAYGTIDLAVASMKLGAYDFISKPFKSDEVLITISKAQEHDQLQRENKRLKQYIRRIQDRHHFGNLIAKSQAMQSVFELAAKVAGYNTTVLVTGESGTGKELVARAIHYASPRKKLPLIPINCGGIPENLLESELFGHVKGAFTGADRTKKGLFEEAHGGTVFLDEIGELPQSMQVKLLRALQENEIRPVGQTQALTVDVRVIAATSRNLSEMVAASQFREDLFYRLNVMPLRIPALRERTEDIPLLCQHFVEQFNRSFGRKIRGVTPAAMSILLQYQWPGNVRELENAIERSIVLSESDWLGPENFSMGALHSDPLSTTGEYNGYSMKTARKRLEKQLIIKALSATDGNRSQAARLLQISHPSLLSKMKAYEIDM